MSEFPLTAGCSQQYRTLHRLLHHYPKGVKKKNPTAIIHENEYYFFFHNLEEGVHFMSLPQNAAFELESELESVAYASS